MILSVLLIFLPFSVVSSSGRGDSLDDYMKTVTHQLDKTTISQIKMTIHQLQKVSLTGRGGEETGRVNPPAPLPFLMYESVLCTCTCFMYMYIAWLIQCQGRHDIHTIKDAKIVFSLCTASIVLVQSEPYHRLEVTLSIDLTRVHSRAHTACTFRF